MMVASDSMMPLTALVVTASSGHRPRIWAIEVFCFQMPLPAMVRNSSRVIIGQLLRRTAASRLGVGPLGSLQPALVTARGVTVAPA